VSEGSVGVTVDRAFRSQTTEGDAGVFAADADAATLGDDGVLVAAAKDEDDALLFNGVDEPLLLVDEALRFREPDGDDVEAEEVTKSSSISSSSTTASPPPSPLELLLVDCCLVVLFVSPLSSITSFLSASPSSFFLKNDVIVAIGCFCFVDRFKLTNRCF